MSTPEEEINETPSWLNEKFIETILRRGKNDDDLCVTHIDAKNAVPKGDNYVSIIRRVATEYETKVGDNRETKRCSLIVKSLPKGEFFQKWIADIGAFVRELHIYEVTMPQINKLVEERTGFEQEPIAPNFYKTDRPNTIILDDLRPMGYKMADRKEGLDLHHSVVAIKALAKFHASSMVLHSEDPATMDFYTESFYIEENRKMLTDFMEGVFNSLASEVETWNGFEHFGPKVKAVSASAVDRMIELVKNKDGALKVLNHGDFWTNNMLFRYENGIAVDVKMVDFQLGRFASPALDILYFLHTSPNQNVLEDFWNHLIGEYLESLNETLKYLGDDRVVSLEDVNRELEEKAYFSVVTSCMFCIMVAEAEDAPDFSEMTEEDLEKGEGMDQMNKAFAGKRFRQAFERRLPTFEKQGLI